MGTDESAAIRVEQLGKQYRLGGSRERYSTLQDQIRRMASLRALLRRGTRGAARPTFWALKDVSFEVKRGECVGIIGRNGAGKSTLLKILSRITEPTEGGADVFGRVSSLLEVGTGFHPELTGRENIYLNGAILGMRRADIVRKFDQIVGFAEVEKFIDTSVKHYSSGMYMRLAFAVAAHLEPDILIVDEVLAVGDAHFQKKCLGKMGEVAHGGRTVLFVSHSMQSITRLCQTGILLEAGQVAAAGPIEKVVAAYLGGGKQGAAEREWPDPARRPGNHVARLRRVRVVSGRGETMGVADIRKPVGVEMEYEVLTGGHVLVPNYQVSNSDGVCVFVASDGRSEWASRERPPGFYTSTVWIPGNFLAEGTHIIGAAVSTMSPVTVHFVEWDAVAFEVTDSLDGDSARGGYAGPMPGVVRPLFDWKTDTSPPQPL